MTPADFVLRRLPLSLRLSVASLVLVLGIGLAASIVHLADHHGKKDEIEGLSLTDLEGAYHGVDQPSRLVRALESEHGREHAPDEAERAALLAWLAGARVNEDYDDEDRLGEMAPALLLDRRCTSCHSRNPADAAGAAGLAQSIPLGSWSDVSRVAFARKLDPVPAEILAMSAHAHATTLPLVALAASLLALATSWPRALVRAAIALTAVGLLVDLSCWWLARPGFAAGWLPDSRLVFVKGIVAGGAAFCAGLAALLLAVLVDVCLPLPARRDADVERPRRPPETRPP